MSLEIEILGETWLSLKEYIPAKERQAAADQLASIIADHNLSDDELATVGGTDSYLGRAIAEYIDEDDED